MNSEEFWKKFPPIQVDCLKMKEEIQAKIYEEIKDMSAEEVLAYFKRAGDELRRTGRIEARDTEPSLVKEDPAPYSEKPPRKERKQKKS